MKAVAVLPGKPNSVHLRDIPVPKLTDQPHPHVCRIPEGRGVLVKVLQVGVDATDREINEALYGNAPPGGEHLVIGHESFGQVVEVGNKVTEVKPGDYVSCTVRRPGGSLFDVIGRNDITSEEVYYERGINLCHGYLTESFVDDAEYIVKVPQNLKHLGVLSEPASVCAKAIEQAFLAQERLQVWQPEAGVCHGVGADRTAGDDDAQAARDGGLHAGDQAGAASQVGDRRGLWGDLCEHPAKRRWRTWSSRWASPT